MPLLDPSLAVAGESSWPEGGHKRPLNCKGSILVKTALNIQVPAPLNCPTSIFYWHLIHRNQPPPHPTQTKQIILLLQHLDADQLLGNTASECPLSNLGSFVTSSHLPEIIFKLQKDERVLSSGSTEFGLPSV